MRYSKKRDQILHEIQTAKHPVSARDIHKSLGSLDLATVYRNLEVFTKEKMIRKLYLNNKEAVYEFNRDTHHHAICVECDKVIHFKAPDEKIKILLGLSDFRVDELDVTVRGICNHKK